MSIGVEIRRLKEKVGYNKSPSYEKLVELKLLINKFYLDNSFTNSELEKRKKQLSKEFSYAILNLITSFIVGLASGMYLNILNYDFILEIYLSLFAVSILSFIAYKINSKYINQHIDELDKFENELIDRLLKENIQEKFINDIKVKSDCIDRYKFCLEKIENYKNDFNNVEILKKYWNSKVIQFELEIEILKKELLKDFEEV